MEEPTNYIMIEGLDKEGIEKLLQVLESADRKEVQNGYKTFTHKRTKMPSVWNTRAINTRI